MLTTRLVVRGFIAGSIILGFVAYSRLSKTITTAQGHSFRVSRTVRVTRAPLEIPCLVAAYSVESLDVAKAEQNAGELLPIMSQDAKERKVGCILVSGTGFNSSKGLISYGSTFDTWFMRDDNGVWKKATERWVL